MGWNILNSIKNLYPGNAVKSLSTHGDRATPLVPSEYNTDNNAWWFFGADGKDTPFCYSGHNSSLKAYEQCPPVTAIINKKAQAYTNGEIYILNSKKKEASGLYADKLRKLFDAPNPLQAWEDFETQGYVYQQVFGFNIILIVKPFGYHENIDASSIWNIPPFMVDITLTNKLYYQSDLKGVIKQVVLNYEGTQTALNIDDIFIMRDVVPSFSQMIFPDSRIRSIQKPISNIIGAYESRGELINYRGARGIFSNKTSDQVGHVPLKDEEKDDLHSQMKRYGLRQGQRQFIITSANLEWQQIGQQVADLMLMEEVQESTMAICDQFGYHYRLLSQQKSASYNDVNDFKKMLYDDTIIPEARKNYRQWNRLFNTKAYNLIIDKDYSSLSVLQEDKLKGAKARYTMSRALESDWKNEIITLNRYRVLQGEDTVPGGDIYYSQWVKDNPQNNNNNAKPTGPTA